MLLKKWLFIVILIMPVVLFANEEMRCNPSNVEAVTDLIVIKKSDKKSFSYSCKQARMLANQYHDRFIKERGLVHTSFKVRGVTYQCSNVPTMNPHPRNVKCDSRDTSVLFAHPTGI
jgi:hypothetical protein